MIPLKSHRVVLDLTFRGYGTSAQLLRLGGDLLGIAAPGDRFDPMPGAVVATMPLGIAVLMLYEAGARFDFIHADVPDEEARIPAIGFFTPEVQRQANTGRRILSDIAIWSEDRAPVIPLKAAVELARNALQSRYGGSDYAYTPGQRQAFENALGIAADKPTHTA